MRKKGIDPSSMPSYEHEFADNRPNVQARLYPIDLLSDFKIWLHNEWIPNQATKYFEQRLPQAIQHIQHLIEQSTGNAGRPPRIIEGIDAAPDDVARAIVQPVSKL